MKIRGYSRTRAVDYATTFALNYDPIWANDTVTNGGNGDCTNFVSQTLFYAGWGMVFGDRFNSHVWYSRAFDYSRSDRSWTWGGAAAFSRYLDLSGRARACDYDELSLGDLVQQLHDGDVIHTMIITKIEGKGGNRKIFLTYHSHDELNKPFEEIKASHGSDFSYIYWKIKDLYVGDGYEYITKNWPSL